MRDEALGYLISADWLLGEGSHLGVSVADAEVHARFERLRGERFKTTAELQGFLRATGYSVSDLLLVVKLQMLGERLQKKIVDASVRVTQSEIARFYRLNAHNFEIPETREVRVIRTLTAAAGERARHQIATGESFASVARRDSIDKISRAHGGLTEIVRGGNPPALAAAVYVARPGRLGGPVKTPLGYFVFRVESVTPRSVRPLAQVAGAIRQQLTETRRTQRLAAFKKAYTERWRSRTDCRPGFVVSDCRHGAR